MGYTIPIRVGVDTSHACGRLADRIHGRPRERKAFRTEGTRWFTMATTFEVPPKKKGCHMGTRRTCQALNYLCSKIVPRVTIKPGIKGTLYRLIGPYFWLVRSFSRAGSMQTLGFALAPKGATYVSLLFRGPLRPPTQGVLRQLRAQLFVRFSPQSLQLVHRDLLAETHILDW